MRRKPRIYRKLSKRRNIQKPAAYQSDVTFRSFFSISSLPKIFIYYMCGLIAFILTVLTIRLFDIMFLTGGSATIAGQEFGFPNKKAFPIYTEWYTINTLSSTTAIECQNATKKILGTHNYENIGMNQYVVFGQDNDNWFHVYCGLGTDNLILYVSHDKSQTSEGVYRIYNQLAEGLTDAKLRAPTQVKSSKNK